jgi:hypothetical protein
MTHVAQRTTISPCPVIRCTLPARARDSYVTFSVARPVTLALLPARSLPVTTIL